MFVQVITHLTEKIMSRAGRDDINFCKLQLVYPRLNKEREKERYPVSQKRERPRQHKGKRSLFRGNEQASSINRASLPSFIIYLC